MKSIRINLIKLTIPAFMMIGLCVANTGYSQDTPQSPEQPMQQPVKEDYTDDELKLFIQANEKIAEAQQQTEQKMVEAIEAESIAVDRFNEILMAQQNPEQELELSEEEQASFDKAVEKLMVHQQELQTQMVSAIEDEGLEVADYQAMMMAYQQSPKVKQKVTEMISAKNPQTEKNEE